MDTETKEEENIREMRRLSDQFGINGVPRLVELAMQKGMKDKIKNLYAIAKKALATKAAQQVLRPLRVPGAGS